MWLVPGKAHECKPSASAMAASSAAALSQGRRGHSRSVLPTLCPAPPQLPTWPPKSAEEASVDSSLHLPALSFWAGEAPVTSAFWAGRSPLLCGGGSRGGRCPSAMAFAPQVPPAPGTSRSPPGSAAQLCGCPAPNQAPPAWSSWQNVLLLPHPPQPGQGPRWRKGKAWRGQKTNCWGQWPFRLTQLGLGEGRVARAFSWNVPENLRAGTTSVLRQGGTWGPALTVAFRQQKTSPLPSLSSSWVPVGFRSRKSLRHYPRLHCIYWNYSTLPQRDMNLFRQHNRRSGRCILILTQYFQCCYPWKHILLLSYRLHALGPTCLYHKATFSAHFFPPVC